MMMTMINTTDTRYSTLLDHWCGIMLWCLLTILLTDHIAGRADFGHESGVVTTAPVLASISIDWCQVPALSSHWVTGIVMHWSLPWSQQHRVTYCVWDQHHQCCAELWYGDPRIYCDVITHKIETRPYPQHQHDIQKFLINVLFNYFSSFQWIEV